MYILGEIGDKHWHENHCAQEALHLLLVLLRFFGSRQMWSDPVFLVVMTHSVVSGQSWMIPSASHLIQLFFELEALCGTALRGNCTSLAFGSTIRCVLHLERLTWPSNMSGKIFFRSSSGSPVSSQVASVSSTSGWASCGQLLIHSWCEQCFSVKGHKGNDSRIQKWVTSRKL